MGPLAIRLRLRYELRCLSVEFCDLLRSPNLEH